MTAKLQKQIDQQLYKPAGKEVCSSQVQQRKGVSQMRLNLSNNFDIKYLVEEIVVTFNWIG